jgi:hypothetical protein
LLWSEWYRGPLGTLLIIRAPAPETFSAYGTL